jgi:hypothetical protein
MDINRELLELTTNLLFKVEFKEEKQHFHLSLYSKDLKDSNGYVCVFDCVNDLEFKIFNFFLESNYSKPYKIKDVLKSALIVQRFYKKLIENNYDILPIIK